jgi:hypothetical protein
MKSDWDWLMQVAGPEFSDRKGWKIKKQFFKT